MNLYRELKTDAKSLLQPDFAARHPGNYLVAKFRELATARAGFKTGKFRALEDNARHEREMKYMVWSVAKSDRNSWSSRISVGRARNNDIIIRHSSISKLHANFVPLVRKDLKGLLQIADAGSANGTRLNGDVLRSDSYYPVKPGDRITFGEVTCEYYSATHLWRVLRQTITASALGSVDS